jgi:NAD(P)H-hydrate epimerase
MPTPIRLTRAQVREVDRRAIEQFGMPGIVLMENAAQAVAAAAIQMLREIGSDRAVILCGGGNNGGDGLAVARLLSNAGIAVTVSLTVDPAAYRGDALTNWRIVQAMELPVQTYDAGLPGGGSLIIDAIFGTGLAQPPRDPFAQIARDVNSCGAVVLAVDLPSGLDCDTGVPLGSECIRAARTVTFVAEKAGFANPAARIYTGEVVVGDIGCPRQIVQQSLTESA